MMNSKTEISILLVEDFEMDSDSTIALLAKAGYSPAQIQVARSTQEAQSILLDSQPDLVILDLHVPRDVSVTMRDENFEIRRSLQFLRDLVQQSDDSLHIIVLSRFPRPWVVYQVLACGVSFIEKNNYRDLPQAVEMARQGHVIVSTNIRPVLRQVFPLSLRVGLDEDDLRIIRCILDGMIDRDIADTLGYSEEWVAGRLRRMFRSHGFHSREELVSWFRDFVEPVL